MPTIKAVVGAASILGDREFGSSCCEDKSELEVNHVGQLFLLVGKRYFARPGSKTKNLGF